MVTHHTIQNIFHIGIIIFKINLSIIKHIKCLRYLFFLVKKNIKQNTKKNTKQHSIRHIIYSSTCQFYNYIVADRRRTMTTKNQYGYGICCPQLKDYGLSPVHDYNIKQGSEDIPRCFSCHLM